MFTTGGRRGACAFFRTRFEEQVHECFLSFAFPLPLSLPLFPSLVSSLPRGSQIAISLAGLSSDRAAARCVSMYPLRYLHACYSARAYLLSCGSRRCKRVDTSTAVRCGRRLMSPRQSRARVCHVDSIRHQRVSHAVPSSAPIFLSFNRPLRILSSDRADIASEMCNLRAALAARDRISQLIHLRTMPLVIRLTIHLETYQTTSYQIEKADRF